MDKLNDCVILLVWAGDLDVVFIIRQPWQNAGDWEIFFKDMFNIIGKVSAETTLHKNLKEEVCQMNKEVTQLMIE